MRSAQQQAVFLGFLGIFAAAAALFAPAERWFGVDLGAVAASTFVVILIAITALFAVRGDQVFPDDMSIAERRAWIGVVFIVIILLSLSRHLWSLSLQQVSAARIDHLFANHFMQRLVMLVIAWALLSHLIGRNGKGVEQDERDLRLRHRADRAGDWALTLIVIACICVLASAPSALLDWWLAPIVLANVLIGVLIAKAFVEHVVLTYAYRAGRA